MGELKMKKEKRFFIQIFVYVNGYQITLKLKK